MELNQRKCKHTACKCLVSDQNLFCSPYCEERADSGDLSCECGHADCSSTIADPAAAFAAAGLG